jgi:hypothetical protein
MSSEEDKVAKSGRHPIALFSIFIILAFLSGCGGGGSGETPVSSGPAPLEPFPAKVLSWQPPTKFQDDTPLEPVKDLANFEIYIKGSGGFTENDSPLALVSAVDPGSGQVATTFNLANLEAFLSRGVVYQVALRAVAINGAKSSFSSPATFSF